MGSPFVSVVTPSYNQVEYLEKAIESVLNQDRDDIEHIVVDGGSDDGTVEVLKHYEDRYNLRWVSESDRGQSHATNKGIRMAEGEWIGWLNSDDRYTPVAIDSLNLAVSREPSADIVYGDLRFIGADGDELFRRYHTRPSPFVQSYYTPFTGNHCMFFAADVFEVVGLIDEDIDFTMDIELYTRILNSDLTCVHHPSVMGEHRIHGDTKTVSQGEAMQMERDAVLGVDSESFFYSAQKAIAIILKLSYIVSDGVDPRKTEDLRWSVRALQYELDRMLLR